MDSTAAIRRYTREVLTAVGTCAIVVLLSFHALNRIEAAWRRILVALLPVLPMALASRTQLRFLRDCDELPRRVQLEAFAPARW